MNESAEIICVGTELLLGSIVNSNAQYLAQQLAQLGIPHYYQTVVGDNPDRIKKAVAIACERSKLLIFTGGLGPTPDDLTTATLADFFETPLVERPELLADMERKFAERGRVMTANNRKQALLPAGAAILPNPTGSAAGMIWQQPSGLVLMTFPGVPSEMYRMWQETAVPYLRQQGWVKGVIHSRTLKFWGIGESTLAEKVAPWLDSPDPTVAPYAGKGEVKLRISTRAPTVAAAEQVIAPVEAALRQIGGLDCYGADEDTLAAVTGDLLRSHHQTIAVAESCTGGGLGQQFTATAGSSDYFLGGVIAYANAVKINLLGVDSQSLDRYGAVSNIVASQMASGVKTRLQTDWGLSITGIAGPGGGTPEKPVGLVYVGLADPGGSVQSFKFQFGSIRSRDQIRHLSALSALDQLRRALLSEGVAG